MKIYRFEDFQEDMLSEKTTTGVKKKRKSETSSINDKYEENINRIKKMKVMAAKKFADKSVDITIRNIESKIKRYENRVTEKELEILKMRDQKLLMKKELANAKERISRKKSLSKKKKK